MEKMLNNRGQIEFDTEMIFAIGLGILTGFLAVFITKSVSIGIIWKILTFLAASATGTIVSYLILTK